MGTCLACDARFEVIWVTDQHRRQVEFCPFCGSERLEFTDDDET